MCVFVAVLFLNHGISAISVIEASLVPIVSLISHSVFECFCADKSYQRKHKNGLQ